MAMAASSRQVEPPSIAQAIVDTLREPLLVLDRDLRVVLASRSFYGAFKVDPQHTQNRLLHELGNGQWDIPSLRIFLERAASEADVVENYEVERTFPTIGHRVMLLCASKVRYESQIGDTILIAFEDITERRAMERERDELLRQKDLLLGEIQHRVSNSLQIIASILLMKARNVSSDETRAHLHDAHKRLLAVAAVQRHLLASTGAETVALERYLVELCASLAGAMIPEDEDAIQLKVHVSGGYANSRTAVSLGLIITELVINALKHAFPTRKPGNAIEVFYALDNADWTLTVSDNGVGKERAEPAQTKGGLGTSIVSALAEQLGADVSMVSGAAGTCVSISHGPARRAA
jgi:two-component sensor histidine kinase